MSEKNRPGTEGHCPNHQRNEENCPCANKDCPNHGICCECIASHRAKDGKVACMRS